MQQTTSGAKRHLHRVRLKNLFTMYGTNLHEADALSFKMSPAYMDPKPSSSTSYHSKPALAKNLLLTSTMTVPGWSPVPYISSPTPTIVTSPLIRSFWPMDGYRRLHANAQLPSASQSLKPFISVPVPGSQWTFGIQLRLSNRFLPTSALVVFCRRRDRNMDVSESQSLSPLNGISPLDPPQILQSTTPFFNGNPSPSQTSSTLSDIYKTQTVPVPAAITLEVASLLVDESPLTTIEPTDFKPVRALPSPTIDTLLSPSSPNEDPSYSPRLHYVQLPEAEPPVDEGVFHIDVDEFTDVSSSIISEDDDAWHEQADATWNTGEGDESWCTQGWNTEWEKHMQRYLSTRSDSEIKNTYKVRKLIVNPLTCTQPYQGPRGKEPGIFAYGPFEYHEEVNPPTALNYHLHVHSTSESDVSDYFACGGPGHNSSLAAAPPSTSTNFPLVRTSPTQAFPISEEDDFIHNVEAYHYEDPRFLDESPYHPGRTKLKLSRPTVTDVCQIQSLLGGRDIYFPLSI
jgi:hypothetical protein